MSLGPRMEPREGGRLGTRKPEATWDNLIIVGGSWVQGPSKTLPPIPRRVNSWGFPGGRAWGRP